MNDVIKYDFSDISIITHVRFDTEERRTNASIRDSFYNKYCTNLEFVYVEDDTTSKLNTVLDDVGIYHLFNNSNGTRKSYCYNIGSTLTKRKYYCFLDLDCIVHPKQILKALEYTKTDTNIGLLYPFNGTAIYLTEKIKTIFGNVLDYDVLTDILPSNIVLDYKDDNLLVGAIYAPGGCMMTRSDNFKKFKGFNPFFVGWGYEDNEIQKRVHKLGYGVSKIGGCNDLLWHLPHDGVDTPEKSAHEYYNHNMGIYNFINAASKEDILEYMKEW